MFGVGTKKMLNIMILKILDVIQMSGARLLKNVFLNFWRLNTPQLFQKLKPSA